MRGQFGRQMEHFANARRALLAPLADGEDQAFVDALQACHSALYPMFEDDRVRDEQARDALAVVRGLLGGGTSPAARVAAMSPAQRKEFSDAVDTLATYFDRAVFC